MKRIKSNIFKMTRKLDTACSLKLSNKSYKTMSQLISVNSK